MTTYLAPSNGALTSRHDVALLDLDGVVYIGSAAVPSAPRALAAARAAGMRLAFVTNNAARPPAAVVAHLVELGIPARVEEVVTSAQTAAHFLARELPPGAPVLVVGTTGLVEALQERGLTPVMSADDSPVAVVQGFAPELDWARLAEGAVAIGRGARWVATNLDATIPSPRGPLPGNGAMVAALHQATGSTPISTGKPDPTMHAETVERSRALRPIVVGDRLDTDIEGATRVGCPSLLVLSGVTDASQLLAAPPGLRPDYLAADVTGLLDDHPGVVGAAGGAACGAWRARAEDGRHVLTASESASSGEGLPVGELASFGEGLPVGESESSGAGLPVDALRALCWMSWTYGRHPVRAGGPAAAAVLAALGLAEDSG